MNKLSSGGVMLSLLCGFAVPAWGADTGIGVHPDAGLQGESSGKPPGTESNAADAAAHDLDFDIPVQPLATALSLYAFVTGQPVLYPSELAAGRTSSALRGRYAADAALTRLLAGTGLAAERKHTDAGDVFVLTEQGTGVGPGAPRIDLAALLQARPNYSGLVQSRIWKAICDRPETRPGHYATVLRFQLGADGGIRAASLVDSTGNARRDAALLKILDGMQIGWPPPPELARQAWTMAILPSGPGSGPECPPMQKEGRP